MSTPRCTCDPGPEGQHQLDRCDLADAILYGPHDCATCKACLHDGRKCCGCYDGACCAIGATGVRR